MNSILSTGLKGFCILAVMGIVAGTASAAEYQVTLQAGQVDAQFVPVTVEIPANWGEKPAVVIDAESGEKYFGQADTTAGKPAISWIIPELKAGAKRRFTIKEGTPNESDSQGVVLTETKDGLDVSIDGKPFTTYLTNAGPKPYFWPILGPTGDPVTRAYPMREDVPGERFDHPHHRSFWFTFDRVNDNDFWSELPRAGKTVHRKFNYIVSGPVFGEFQSVVDWISKEGEKVCQDVRTFRFWRNPQARLFDSEIRWQATEGPLTLGDSKEGLFGFRVAGTMKVDQSRNEDKSKPEGGTLLNSNGEKNDDTWGKRAEWCDYYGPVAGKIVGIAIMDHPTSFRHPTYWHSRTYGLFAANPFGISHFTNDKNADGSHTIPAGEELQLRYRVYIHSGDTMQAKVAAQYAAYADPPKARLE